MGRGCFCLAAAAKEKELLSMALLKLVSALPWRGQDLAILETQLQIKPGGANHLFTPLDSWNHTSSHADTSGANLEYAPGKPRI